METFTVNNILYTLYCPNTYLYKYLSSHVHKMYCVDKVDKVVDNCVNLFYAYKDENVASILCLETFCCVYTVN